MRNQSILKVSDDRDNTFALVGISSPVDGLDECASAADCAKDMTPFSPYPL